MKINALGEEGDRKISIKIKLRSCLCILKETEDAKNLIMPLPL
jgi:hypothetical protein